MNQKKLVKLGCALLAGALLFGSVVTINVTPNVVYAEPDNQSGEGTGEGTGEEARILSASLWREGKEGEKSKPGSGQKHSL